MKRKLCSKTYSDECFSSLTYNLEQNYSQQNEEIANNNSDDLIYITSTFDNSEVLLHMYNFILNFLMLKKSLINT